MELVRELRLNKLVNEYLYLKQIASMSRDDLNRMIEGCKREIANLSPSCELRTGAVLPFRLHDMDQYVEGESICHAL